MSLDTNTIQYLQTLKREINTQVVEYGKYTQRERTALYNDDAGSYTIISKANNNKIDVHSSKSFVEVIKEELKRRGNETGKNATLSIGLNGGYFVADDDFGEGKAEYHRILSQQWEVLKSINDRIMEHEEFLLALLKLSPSVQEFQKTYRAFLKIRIVGNSEMTSNPVFVDNQAESGYLVKYKLEGGQNADTVLPDGFTVNVPYIKASKKLYNIKVDVQILNSASNQLRIKVNIPLFENIEETAIIDEINSIKKSLSGCTDLLVLSDI